MKLDLPCVRGDRAVAGQPEGADEARRQAVLEGDTYKQILDTSLSWEKIDQSYSLSVWIRDVKPVIGRDQ